MLDDDKKVPFDRFKFFFDTAFVHLLRNLHYSGSGIVDIG